MIDKLNLSEEEIEFLSIVRGRITSGSRESDPKTKIHWCRYCGEVSNWNSSVFKHDHECPIMLYDRFLGTLGLRVVFGRVLRK